MASGHLRVAFRGVTVGIISKATVIPNLITTALRTPIRFHSTKTGIEATHHTHDSGNDHSNEHGHEHEHEHGRDLSHEHDHEHTDKKAVEEEDDEMEDMFIAGPSLNKVEWRGPTRGGARPEPTRYGDWERKGRCSDF
jgi:hypothetical protein